MNLTSKFILVILLITSLVVSVFTYIQITEKEEILKSELQKRITLMKNNIELNAKHQIKDLKDIVENDIASFNFSHIEITFQKLINKKNINAINMNNLDKDVNLFIGDKSFKKYFYINEVQQLTIKEIKDGNNFLISETLNFTNKWGSLNIVYSLSDLKEKITIEEQLITAIIKESIEKTIYASIIFALLIIFFAFMFTRKLILPILLLTEIAKQIANGKMNVYNEFENIKREDEIGVLYNTFKIMSIKLESSYKKLNILNESLEAKVIKRTQQLLLEKQKAEESTKIKSEFLATMSHEIRTPMNGILGMSYLTLQTPLNEQQEDYVMKIEQSAKSLMTLINDILDFSKLEASKLTISNVEFNLFLLLQELINVLKIEANKKDLEIILEYNIINHNFYGDSLRITQILTNVISNAIKFTNKGNIKISISNTSVNHYQFSISDTGIGITKEELSKLFKSFSQADSSTTRKYGGTGLGLIISKQLTELMNGKIWVESEKDVGSIFHVEIELKVLNTPLHIDGLDKHTPTLDINTLENSKILLVEDNVINQEIILGLLENSSIQIDIANNGKEAIEIFDSNIHKIIFMDIKMPIMDGIEATQIIRAKNQTIPIIALTANSMKEVISLFQEIGMNEHLDKPIDIEKLNYILHKYLLQKVSELKIPEFILIDSKTALKYLNNNKKLYLKILKNFYNNYKDINFFLMSKTEKEREIHTLKGLSLNIGAETLHQTIRKFELSKDKSSFDLIENQLNYVIKELEIVEKISDEKKFRILSNIKLSDTERSHLFQELYDSIKQRKPKLCANSIHKIDTYKLEHQDDIVLEKIKIEIKQYNFKKANILLKEIL